MALLTPLFFAYKYDFKRKRYLTFLSLLFLIPVDLIFKDFDTDAVVMVILSSLFCLGIILWAFYRKKRHVLLDVLGILTFICFLFFNKNLAYIGYTALILSNLVILSQLILEKDRAIQAALLKAKKLELSLLKKHIQPHFLLNTLSSLIAWIEESPKVGIQMIEELANEFSILMNISDRQLILLSEEIQLCRAHLQIMNRRKRIQYRLDYANLDLNREIPPALFLTVIENGITHNQASKGTMLFEISEKQDQANIIYEVKAYSKSKPDFFKKEGTGFKYIVKTN